jgi:hypothetical protein
MAPLLPALVPLLSLIAAYDVQPFPSPPESSDWSVVLRGGNFTILKGRSMDEVAWGSYSDLIHETGWGLLDVHSSPSFDGETQSFAAGFLEGYLTHERIAHSVQNTWGIDFPGATGSVPDEVRSFIEANNAWMRGQIASNPHDDYWRMLSMLLKQTEGIAAGYAAGRTPNEPALGELEVYMLNLINADMDDLTTALKVQAETRSEELRPVTLREVRQTGHCSVMVKTSPDLQDLWVSHATWDVYRNMLRMIKYMDLPLPGARARRVSFSSFPGSLYSTDGFHVTSAGLTVVETTISNYNRTLWKGVSPNTVMTWARAMVANRLGTSGDTWTEYQLRHNSGTCNNQWIVVDYNLFQPGKELRDGTIWISETMPGHGRRSDVTRIAAKSGAWVSYNIPFFDDIWQVGGWGAMQVSQPNMADEFSYERAPRALMFQRALDSGVDSLQSFMQLMRYNDAGHDPLADGDACNGISARCDLNPHNSSSYNCFGAHDAKVTHLQSVVRDMSFLAILSPTYDDNEPFSWSQQDSSAENCRPEQHVGHPDVFNFGWYSFPSSFEHPPRAGLPLASEELARYAVPFAAVVLLALCVSLIWIHRKLSKPIALSPSVWSGSSSASSSDYTLLEA